MPEQWPVCAGWGGAGRRSWRYVILVGLLTTAPVHAQLAAPRLASAAVPLVLADVTVIDVRDGRRLPHQTVVIVGTRIRALGRTRAMRIPSGARVVNARGKDLAPGL